MSSERPSAKNPLRADEQERVVVSGMLHGTSEADDGIDLLNPSDFYNLALRQVFESIVDMRNLGKKISVDAVFIFMKANNQFADLPENPGLFLADLYESTATAANMAFAAASVRDASIRRTVTNLCSQLTRDLLDNIEPAEETVSRYEQAIAASTEDVRGDAEPVPFSKSIVETFERIQDVQNGLKPRYFAGSGFSAIDNGLGGFCEGQLVILAARPGIGKTALAMQVAVNVARQGIGTLVFSLEMVERELIERAISFSTQVPLSQMRRRGGIKRQDSDRMTEYYFSRDENIRIPLWVTDKPNLTASVIATRARRMVRRHGVRLIVIDYLQLMKPDNPRDPRHLQVGQSCKILKQLAKESKVAIICLAQLNRAGEGNEKPKLQHLRESGDIEQDADAVMMLHRLDDSADVPTHLYDLIINKNRNGPIGEAPLLYHRPYTMFQDRSIEV